MRISESSNDSIQQLYKNLSAHTREHQFKQLVHLLHAISETDEHVAETAWESWNYLETNRLWDDRYPSLEAFQDAINYEGLIKNIVDRRTAILKRKQTETRGIRASWGVIPDKALPLNLLPPKLSKHMLTYLNRISTICPPEEAISTIGAQVTQRLSTPALTTRRGVRDSRATHALPGNVKKVWKRKISLAFRSRASEASSRSHNDRRDEEGDGEEEEGKEGNIEEEGARGGEDEGREEEGKEADSEDGEEEKYGVVGGRRGRREIGAQVDAARSLLCKISKA